jgi:uncharacterized membrane protein YphA (DoxX/SURF4 family)
MRWGVRFPGDAAILYCFVLLYFFAVGAGVWSIEKLLATRGCAAAFGSRA